MENIETMLNNLDELLENSTSLPFSGGKCLVDAERVRELIDNIRLNMPAEISQARALIADRNEIIAVAKTEAESLIRKAEERARVMVDNDTLMRQANAKAMSILSEASQKAADLVKDATEKASDITSKANARATEAITQATTRSREMKQAAYDFSETMMRTAEETLAQALSEVKSTRQAFRNSAKEPQAKAPAKAPAPEQKQPASK